MIDTINIQQIKTLGSLKEAGIQTRSIKDELRANLIQKIKDGEKVFEGIYGYEETVIPEIERAILSRHNMLFLGLRGQAKTRLARLMTKLLDEWIPYIQGTELIEDPFNPVSRKAISMVSQIGDETPIAWLHRSERYAEKLATPDVSVADLIGDIDPIKAANMKISYADERAIHFGLVPRSNRCIFVINELPDLQARIQVALFNILQEGDIQIRGFKLRMPLDIQFVFTANPEDYTNRGSIVTPLKDRIESQILTHYPKDIQTSRTITDQEAKIPDSQSEIVELNEVSRDLVEQIAIEARESEYVDQNSGVSARLTISAFENMISTTERRALREGINRSHVRVSDLWGVVPAITGKIELVYEGEQEGPGIVARNLISKAIRTTFARYFPDPDSFKKTPQDNPYNEIKRWFGKNSLNLLNESDTKTYQKALNDVPGLAELVKQYHPDATGNYKWFLMEFVLHGMTEYSLIGKSLIESGVEFKDLLTGMFSGGMEFEDDFDEDDF